VIIFGTDKSKLIEVQGLSRSGNNVVFKGKIMGAMPVSGVVRPSQVRVLLKMLGWRMIVFLVTLPFRKDAP
jgi:hypothetical protein